MFVPRVRWPGIGNKFERLEGRSDLPESLHVYLKLQISMAGDEADCKYDATIDMIEEQVA